MFEIFTTGLEPTVNSKSETLTAFSNDDENLILKWTVQRDFRPACATDQRVKIFSILVKNSRELFEF